MAYIQVDLDAFVKAEPLARMAGVSLKSILGELALLWRYCFDTNENELLFEQIEAIVDRKGCVEHYIAFGFLEKTEHGARVCGTDRYSKNKAAKSRAGKASWRARANRTGVEQVLNSRSNVRSTSVPKKEKEKEKEKEEATPEKPDCAFQVFEAYVQARNKTKGLKLKGGRRKLIQARLDEGFTVEQLAQAAQGVKNDSWPERPRFDGIEYVYESADTVEKFIGLARDGPPKPQASLQDLRTKPVRAEDMDWSNVPLGRVS